MTTWVVPSRFSALEDALYAATRAHLGGAADAVLATAALTRAIVDRSQRYTSDRGKLSAPRDRAGDLVARAVFFTITDAMKIAIPLGELARRRALPARRPLRVVDLGAGCGAMSLGMTATLVDDMDITGVDRDGDALAIASAAMRAFATSSSTAHSSATHASAAHASAAYSSTAHSSATHASAAHASAAPSATHASAAHASAARTPVPTARCSFTTRVGDVMRLDVPACDLVVMGTVLNELEHDDALALVRRALGAIADDGAVIIIEPALRDTSRALHAIRDALIDPTIGMSKGLAAHVFAPCTRRIAPCTALIDPDDWCHEDRPLALPPRTAELARLTHLRDSGMKFSYLVLRKQPLDLVEEPDAWRLVSAPRIAKGKLEITGCANQGRVPLRLLKRNRNAENRALERADRGHVVVTRDAVADGRVEITNALRLVRLESTRDAEHRGEDGHRDDENGNGGQHAGS